MRAPVDDARAGRGRPARWSAVSTALVAGTVVLTVAYAPATAVGDLPVTEPVPPAGADPVFVHETEVAADGRVWSIEIAGEVPTSCHAPQTLVVPGDGDVSVTVWSERQDAGSCEPFRRSFRVTVGLPVGGEPTDVLLNGDHVASIDP